MWIADRTIRVETVISCLLFKIVLRNDLTLSGDGWFTHFSPLAKAQDTNVNGRLLAVGLIPQWQPKGTTADLCDRAAIQTPNPSGILNVGPS